MRPREYFPRCITYEYRRIVYEGNAVPAEPHAIELTIAAARAAADKLGEGIVALDVADRLALTDVFLIVSGQTERQVHAIVDAVDEAMRNAGSKIVRREGTQELRWVLLDYGDVIVHVQHVEDRDFYGLDRLWKDCPEIDLPADVVAAPASGEGSA